MQLYTALLYTRAVRKSIAADFSSCLDFIYRTEWLQMKKLYRDMQKEHMRQLKSECQGDSSWREKERKGFVSHCLVKVACTGGDVTADQLRVSGG